MGQAFYQWQDDDTAVELRGLIRGFGVAINNPNDSVLYAKDKLITGGGFGRLMLDIQYKSSLSFELHALQSIVDDQLRTGGSRFSSPLDVERSDAMHWRFADQHADLLIDRFNMQYVTDKLTIKLGRQPINLATTFYFTPNDFFAPYAAQIFYRSYKPGVDAARLDWQWSELSQLSLMTVVDYKLDVETSTGWSNSPDWSETSYLARISTLFNIFEFAGLAGKVNGDDIIGMDFQGELFDWLGVRGEGHMRFPDEVVQSRDVKFSLGFEHRFENTLTLRLEQFYQGAWGSDNNDYNAAILTENTTFYLARNYTAFGVNYEITSLLFGDAVWLFNNDDSSSLLALYASYSLSDESELALGLNLAVGERPINGIISSEFGGYPASLNVEYRLFF
ncbi:MAG: hypothetical protein MUQ51_08370 [Pseudomonadota bacterium]|nr:hypothetical protein [Pseudomonadota bacterium]MDO7711612.1 hypothetical protein [Pseudomonadota bacterium]